MTSVGSLRSLFAGIWIGITKPINYLYKIYYAVYTVDVRHVCVDIYTTWAAQHLLYQVHT